MEEGQFPSHVIKQKVVSDTAPASAQMPPKQPHRPRGPAGVLGLRLPDRPWEGRAWGALPPEDGGVGSPSPQKMGVWGALPPEDGGVGSLSPQRTGAWGALPPRGWGRGEPFPQRMGAWGALLLGGLGVGSPGGAGRREQRRAYCRIEQEQATGVPANTRRDFSKAL